MTTLEFMIAFLGGFLTHKVFHWLYTQGTMVIAFHEVQKSAINSLSTVFTHVETAMSIKHDFLESIELGEKRLLVQKNIDKTQIQSMKDSAIRDFTNRLPRYITSTAKYKNWQGAIEYYNQKLK